MSHVVEQIRARYLEAIRAGDREGSYALYNQLVAVEDLITKDLEMKLERDRRAFALRMDPPVLFCAYCARPASGRPTCEGCGAPLH